jgi:hypothetical protein
VFALVLEAEEAAFPHVREAVAAFVFGRALFKAVVLAGRIGGGGRGVVKDAAEIEEVLLGGGALLQFHLSPLRYEFGDRHGGAMVGWRVRSAQEPTWEEVEKSDRCPPTRPGPITGKNALSR